MTRQATSEQKPATRNPNSGFCNSFCIRILVTTNIVKRQGEKSKVNSNLNLNPNPCLVKCLFLFLFSLGRSKVKCCDVMWCALLCNVLWTWCGQLETHWFEKSCFSSLVTACSNLGHFTPHSLFYIPYCTLSVFCICPSSSTFPPLVFSCSPRPFLLFIVRLSLVSCLLMRLTEC